MKKKLYYFVVLIFLFSGWNLHAQNILTGFWSEARFSEGYFEIEDDAPNSFVLIFDDKDSTYTMVECKVDSEQKIKKGQEFPITFFGILNEELDSFNKSFNIVQEGDSISHVNIGFVRLLRNGLKPVFEIHFYGNYGKIDQASIVRKKFKRRKFD